MNLRSAVPDFQLANPLYIGAVVSFWTVDINGAKTNVLANLYAEATGSTQITNPQILDGEGKVQSPVYIDTPVIAEVTSAAAATSETGVILPAASFYGDWASGISLWANQFVQDPTTLSIYVATNYFVTSGNIPTDVGNGDLKLVYRGESIAQASAAAAAAQQSALASAQSAADAAATLANTVIKRGTSAVIPGDTTANRPSTVGFTGFLIRYSTTFNAWEGFNGANWGALLRNIGEIGNVDMVTTPPASGDGIVYDGTNWKPGPAGGGMFNGNSGVVGSRIGDIFRLNAQTLTADVTIGGSQNAEAVGPLTVNTGITLTVSAGGTLVIL